MPSRISIPLINEYQSLHEVTGLHSFSRINNACFLSQHLCWDKRLHTTSAWKQHTYKTDFRCQKGWRFIPTTENLFSSILVWLRSGPTLLQPFELNSAGFKTPPKRTLYIHTFLLIQSHEAFSFSTASLQLSLTLVLLLHTQGGGGNGHTQHISKADQHHFLRMTVLSSRCCQ